jgi:ATP-dependent Clp protease ATP-binding subunit ClpX
MYELPSDDTIKELVIDEGYARAQFDKSKFKRLQVA